MRLQICKWRSHAIVNARAELHVESEWREKQCAPVLRGALSAPIIKMQDGGKYIPAGNVCMLLSRSYIIARDFADAADKRERGDPSR